MQNHKPLQVSTAGSATSAVKGRTVRDDNFDKQGGKAGHLGCELMVSHATGLYPGGAIQASAMEKNLFACEQPRDPTEYREDGTENFSVWQTARQSSSL